ncbi:MAG: DUF5309 family protein [Clostridia bacterium]|nr:DUF5309 family protein [Clostridia bacterium]
MKKNVFNVLSLALVAVSALFGGGVAMATVTAMGGVAADLPEGGATITDAGAGATATTGIEVTEESDPDFYAKAVDKRITRMRPMRTPIDQITRSAESINRVNSMIVQYYAVATRPIKATLTAQVAAMSGSSVTLPVSDPNMFSETDTIRVHGVKGYKEDGVTQDTKDLMLYVVGKNDDGFPNVIAVNGLKSTNGNSKTPQLAEGAVLIRMGRAASEIDVETGNFYNLPTPSEQYCQKFMMQVEQSTAHKMWDKKIDWNFSDIEEDGIYDMRLGMENSFLFGIKGKGKDPRKSGADVYFTGGIYWMAGKKMGLGTVADGVATITDDEMVDFLKDLFTGNDSGNGQKIGFAGSDALAALAKMKSERFKVVKEFEKWGLKFTSFDSNFGKLLVMHHELMDKNEKSDEIFIVDPEYLRKKYFETWSRKEYDMAKLAKRDTQAVVMKEASCCYLTYPNAHAIVKLGELA